MLGQSINDELKRTWKEAVVAYLKVLSQHLPEGNGEIHEKLRMASL
jgi:hypothetical protein